MFDHSKHPNDNGFERQVIRATQKLSFGERVANPWLLACAEIMLKDFDPGAPIEGSSNGAESARVYVGPK